MGQWLCGPPPAPTCASTDAHDGHDLRVIPESTLAPPSHRLGHHAFHDRVERRARAHGLRGALGIGLVVAADVDGVALGGEELRVDLVLVRGQGLRDRLEAVGRNIDANGGTFVDDGKQLLDDYITREELWACTTCNACTEACPLSIDPLSIIVDMRRYLVMEQSAAPNELNVMMGNLENNGAPWPFNQMDRMKWAEEAGS